MPDSTARRLPSSQREEDRLSGDIDTLRKLFADHGPRDTINAITRDLILHQLAEKACSAAQAASSAIALCDGNEIVCRAAYGESAPELGLRIDARRGLTGECIRQRKTQFSEDCSRDPRVDGEACRLLGVRSFIVVPLARAGDLLGVLEVFFDTPRVFEPSLLAALEEAGTQIVSAVTRVEQEPVVTVVEHTNDAEVSPDLPSAAAPPPTKEPRAETLAAPQFLTQPPERVRRRHWSNVALMIGLLGAACAFVGVIWWVGRARAAPPKAARNVAQPVPQPVAAQEMAVKHEEPAITVTARPPTAVPVAITPQPTKTLPRDSVPAGGLVVYEKGKVVYRSAPVQPAAMNERIANRPRTPEATPANAEITGGRLLRRVEPVYDESLKAQGLQGRVILRVVVGKDGTVETASVIEGDPRLAEAAIAAVRQWQYEPYRLNGDLVQMESRVTITFGLSQP